MQVTVEIPDESAHYLFPEGQDASRLFLEDLVANAFREGRIESTAQVRRLLGYKSRFEALDFLSRHHLSIFTVEELEKDFATHDRLFSPIAEKSAA